MLTLLVFAFSAGLACGGVYLGMAVMLRVVAEMWRQAGRDDLADSLVGLGVWYVAWRVWRGG